MREKCAIVIGNAFSYAGTEKICDYMSNCLSDEVDVTVLSLMGGGEPFYPYRSVTDIISFDKSKSPLFSICKLIISNDYKYVFLVSMGKLSFIFSLFGLLLPKLKKRKLVACEHVSINSFSFPIKQLKLWSLKRFSKVITLTTDDFKFLKRKKIDADVISNPIFFKSFVKNKINYRALAIGRLEYQKGYDILIDIWAEFHKENPSWKLDIAGDGSESEKLKKMIEDNGLSDSVKLLGKISDVDKLYKNSDIFLMTSRYEGLPLVLLEAKSWSLPVIAFDCPTGPKEIISDNVDGFLIPMQDKSKYLETLKLLTHSHDTILKMSRNTRQTHLKFSEPKIRSKWKKIVSAGNR